MNRISNPSVTVVISGKHYLNVPKNVLLECSGYFRALFSGRYGDSNQGIHYFPDWSTLAFEVLLSYLNNNNISLKGTRNETIENTLKMSDFLCCDSFLPYMRKTLISSWTEMGLVNVLYLAARLRLDVTEEIVDNSLQKVGSLLINNVGEDHGEIQYEQLNLALSIDRFWQYSGGASYDCVDFFRTFTCKQESILHWVTNNPPHRSNIRRMARLLKLELLPWNNAKLFLNKSVGNHASTKCLKLAFQHRFSEFRQEIGSRISHLRISFTSGKKIQTVGITEFNLDTWTWEFNVEFKTRFSARYCVMARDYANFMGDTGIMTLRKGKRKPKIVSHVYLGEIFKHINNWQHWNDCFVTKCVVGRTIYILVQHRPLETGMQRAPFSSFWYSQPTLFKFDVFNYDFDFCTFLQVTGSKMIGQGKLIYIAGFSLDDPHQFKVLCFDSLKYTLKTMGEIDDFQDHVDPYFVITNDVHHLIFKNRLLYVFFSSQYIIVDTAKNAIQKLEFRRLESYLTQGWAFSIRQACAVKDGVMFLLDIKHSAHNCDFLGLMVSHFNTDTLVFQSFGFLPNPEPEFRWYLLCGDHLDIQLEERTSKSPPLLISENFVTGIQDLNNLPHKNSSRYY